MLTLAINSVRVREYPLICKINSWDNGTVSHDFYHALLPKLADDIDECLFTHIICIFLCTFFYLV